MEANQVRNTPTSDGPTLDKKLRDVIRHASISRLKIHSDSLAIECREMDSGFKPGRVLGSNMVFILVSGQALRLTFKVHFSIGSVKSLAFRIFGGSTPADISEKQVIDYFKEYANLVAGNIVALLAESGIELGISLPLSTRGFYEVFSDYPDKQDSVNNGSDFWGLQVNGTAIFCSAHFEILNRGLLKSLTDYEILESVSDADGEMDFL